MSNEFNWKSFFYSVNNNGIVPVIGNDLSIVKILKTDVPQIDISPRIMQSVIKDGDYVKMNLYDYLALKVWDIFGSGAPPKKVTINYVVQRLEDLGVNENDIDIAIKTEVTKLTNDQIVMDPYKKLIQITGFDTILAVNIDNFLERAFEAEGMHVNAPINYSIPMSAIDQSVKPDKALVSIYNLMGNVAGNNFATNEEQALEYLFMLQNGAETSAKPLFDAIKGKSILLLGCSFPNWFMRFFIRTISRERFKASSKSKYVASDKTTQDDDLYSFLENNKTQVIRIGKSDSDDEEHRSYNNSIEFIDEMYDNWSKSNIAEKRNEVKFKELVFLSYSWSDKTIVEKIKNEFERNGVKVFFDDDKLRNGDKFADVIKKYVKDCDLFVPLISDNAIKDPKRYVYDIEWRNAIFLAEWNERNFIRPYIIDDTEPTDDRIPAEIRQRDIDKIDTDTDFGPIVRKFIEDNELTPIDS